MITLLSKLFIKNKDSMSHSQLRQAYGTLCCFVGIFLNVALFAGKYLAGYLSGSIAVTADAFNNLSDAGSSVITLAGLKLAEKKPDVEHPFGHGRAEYLSGLAVSVIIIVVGVELLRSSVDKLLHPVDIDASPLAIGILAASIAVKLYMFIYNRRIGTRISSAGMKAAAADSISDSAATLAVLISTVLTYFTDIHTDGFCGILVSMFILYTGITSAKDTLSPLLGTAPEKEFVEKIEEIALSYSQIRGIHDLIAHDYGPGRKIVSLHAEVDGSENIFVLHDAIDNAEHQLMRELGCLAVIHMDPVETDNEAVTETREAVARAVKAVDEGITIHDFRMVPGTSHTNLIFDAVVPFNVKRSDEELKSEISLQVAGLDEKFCTVVNIDRPYI